MLIYSYLLIVIGYDFFFRYPIFQYLLPISYTIFEIENRDPILKSTNVSENLCFIYFFRIPLLMGFLQKHVVKYRF